MSTPAVTAVIEERSAILASGGEVPLLKSVRIQLSSTSLGRRLTRFHTLGDGDYFVLFLLLFIYLFFFDAA